MAIINAARESDERSMFVRLGRDSALFLTRSMVYSWNSAVVMVAAAPMPAAMIVSEMPIRVLRPQDAIRGPVRSWQRSASGCVMNVTRRSAAAIDA